MVDNIKFMKKILTPKVIDLIIGYSGIGISCFLATKIAHAYFGGSHIVAYSLILNGIVIASSIVIIRKLRRAGISWKKWQDL